MSRKYSIFFDAEDYEVRRVVRQFSQHQGKNTSSEEQHLFRATLHPHGIKELALSKELRVAQAVIDLLSSLKDGQANDRLNTLQILRDEVLYSESSGFRYNTGRVLIQIMKSLIRAYDDPELQLRLAHDFRLVASGRRRIVRQMLQRYHLVEIPEAWNHVAFDNHVHDANTKGRKTPTHLIMDAWIKGIRKLNVVYYNYVEPAAVAELMQAAKIMDIEVQIGVEFQVYFRERYVQFVWEPTGFINHEDLNEFLNENAPRTLMEMGRQASLFHHHYVLKLLEKYNEELRFEIGQEYNVDLPTFTEQDISSVVGGGQTSRTHLAELIYRLIHNTFKEQLPELKALYSGADAERKKELEEISERMNSLTPEAISQEWLSLQKNPDIPLPRYTEDMVNVPEIMRFLPATLMGWITSIRSSCNIILNLQSLTAEDVIELVYSCDGMITHLELFNLKNYAAGKMQAIPEISELLTIINNGSAIVLKRLIRNMINELSCSATFDKDERCAVLSSVLRNIPRLQSFYKLRPLKTRIGSDSTSRSSNHHGMGFVLPETLSKRSRNFLEKNPSQGNTVPLTQDVSRRTTYYLKPYQKLGITLTRFIRRLPGCSLFALERKNEWILNQHSAQHSKQGNIAMLGGFQAEQNHEFDLTTSEKTHTPLSFTYLNTTVKNILKVLLGFVLTLGTFRFTQDWWFLVWFGPIIWFAITGFRNIVQATLGGGGIRRTPLLRWNDYISWSRLSDSLMFTGFSVPILELGVRWFLLERVFQIGPATHPMVFFTIISLVNGLYISAHNLYRGLPPEAVIGNIFRSFIAIPVSIVYSESAHEIFLLMGWSTLIIQQGAAVISKMASDTVAAIIEGFADKVEFLRIRHWDYSAKLNQLLDTFTELEILLPEEDLIEHFRKTGKITTSDGDIRVERLERTIIISALDLLYFWMYLPRARSSFIERISTMTPDEVAIFMQSQASLLNVQRVSQLFVDGLVGASFAKPLSFYLAKYEEYLADMQQLTGLIPLYDEEDKKVA